MGVHPSNIDNNRFWHTHPNDSQSSQNRFLDTKSWSTWTIWREPSFFETSIYWLYEKAQERFNKGSAPRKNFAADWIFSWFRNALEAILGIILWCQILEEIIRRGYAPSSRARLWTFPMKPVFFNPDISGWETMASTSSLGWSPNPCAMLPTRSPGRAVVRLARKRIGGFLKWVYPPKWRAYYEESHEHLDDWGIPLFQETTNCFL